MAQFNSGLTISFNIGDTKVELAQSDVLIEVTQREGYVSETDRETTGGA